MTRTIFILLVSFVFSSTAFSQDSLVLQGHYNGRNLYVINPTVVNGKDSSFCVKRVAVNNQPTNDEIRSNSFQIDFTQMFLQIGAPVKVSIMYDKGCAPKVVNPEVLQTKSSFSFVTAKAEKSAKLIWTVKGDLYSSFIIEDFRWNKWMTIAEVDNMDTIKKNTYSYEIKPHFGMNQFRISHTDEKGNTVYTKLIKCQAPPAVKEIFLTATKVTDEISFTGETEYEIFDNDGNFISDGYGDKVSITDLPKGKYTVNYDNKTEIISKK